MITGVVTADREPRVRVTVRGPDGQEQDLEAVIDTGFDGSLALPSVVIAALGLPWRRRGRALLADGRETLFDIHEATIIWDGEPRRVAVDAVDASPLIGMRLLEGYELTIQVVLGGPVVVKRLPLQQR
jgi:clan AA aspartic protease